MPTKAELIEECKRLNIKGYSGKRKVELERMCIEANEGVDFTSPYHKLISFMEGFGVEGKLPCVKETASYFNVSEDEVSKILLEDINNQVNACVGYSTDKPLFNYQKKVTNHIFANRGLIAAFDTGTGKTLTAVSTAACMHSMGKLFGKDVKILVVTPASLKANMAKEFRKYPYKFGKSLEIISSNIFRDAMLYHLILRRGGAKDDEEKKFIEKRSKYADIMCDSNTFLIIDEAHEFKTDYAQIFEKGWKKAGEYPRAKMFVEECYPSVWKILALTATPMLNKWHDIMNLIASVKNVQPKELKQYIGFRSEEIKLSKNQQDVLETDKVNVKEPEILNKSEFRDVILFKQVEKTSEVFPMRREEKYVSVPMPIEYFNAVQEIKRKIGPKPKEKSQIQAWLEKRQKAIANLPNNPKLKFVRDYIRSEKYDKIIIYSRFVTPLKKLEPEIKKMVPRNWKVFLITGSSVAPAKRQEVLEEINKHEKAVVLISDAGSMGLDFKGLELVIIYEPGVNIAREEQVIGRAIRYKSHLHLPAYKRRVDIIRLVLHNPPGLPKIGDIRTADQRLAINALKKYYGTLALRKQLEKLQI